MNNAITKVQEAKKKVLDEKRQVEQIDLEIGTYTVGRDVLLSLSNDISKLEIK